MRSRPTMTCSQPQGISLSRLVGLIISDSSCLSSSKKWESKWELTRASSSVPAPNSRCRPLARAASAGVAATAFAENDNNEELGDSTAVSSSSTSSCTSSSSRATSSFQAEIKERLKEKNLKYDGPKPKRSKHASTSKNDTVVLL